MQRLESSRVIFCSNLSRVTDSSLPNTGMKDESLLAKSMQSSYQAKMVQVHNHQCNETLYWDSSISDNETKRPETSSPTSRVRLAATIGLVTRHYDAGVGSNPTRNQIFLITFELA